MIGVYAQWKVFKCWFFSVLYCLMLGWWGMENHNIDSENGCSPWICILSPNEYDKIPGTEKTPYSNKLRRLVNSMKLYALKILPVILENSCSENSLENIQEYAFKKRLSKNLQFYLKLHHQVLLVIFRNFQNSYSVKHLSNASFVIQDVMQRLYCLSLSWRRSLPYRNQSNQWAGFYIIGTSVVKEIKY